MHQQEFKTNLFLAVILPIIITIVILGIYFVADSVPLWVLVLLIIPLIFAVAGQKTKLIIADDMLRYQKVFGSNEVSLKNVSQIVIREVETIIDRNQDSINHNQKPGLHQNGIQVNQERKVEKLFYVLDETGRTFFSFPANLVGLSNRRRFEEAVNAINPNIDFL